MNNWSKKRSNNGQALIVTALIITLMLISTICYVLETEKDTISLQSTTDMDLLAIKDSSKNTLISALANISNYDENGGERGNLTKDLKMLSTVLHAHSYGVETELSFKLLNSSTYRDGVWISWENPGFGVSSAYASFAVNESQSALNYFAAYEMNITTALRIEGVYTNESTEKTVNITCTVYDENGPALANKIDIFYQTQTDGSWTSVGQDNLTIVPYGNGTYNISFPAYSPEPIKVSAQVNDVRNIFVMANVTL
jgi:hypothetical protein